MFGTDETILDVQLKNGFSFVKRSLNTLIDNLDSVFEIDAMGLCRAYEEARVSRKNLDVICMEKCFSVELDRKKSGEFFDKQVDEDLVSLDDQIRAIRLVSECPLRCKNISFSMTADIPGYGIAEFNAMVPISESNGTTEISKFHCDPCEIKQINAAINQIEFPIKNDILNIAHRYYDLSYHQDNYISITLLFVALEMIFISKESNKNIPLSKRCAVYMFEEEEKRLECYNKLLTAYKQRNKFIHEGDFRKIEGETIVFLRKCVRYALTNIDIQNFNKKKFINELKEKVKVEACWEY